MRTRKYIAMYPKAVNSKKYKALYWAITLLLMVPGVPLALLQLLGDGAEYIGGRLANFRYTTISKIFIWCKWEGAKIQEWEVDD